MRRNAVKVFAAGLVSANESATVGTLEMTGNAKDEMDAYEMVQVSTLSALVAGAYDGVMTYRELEPLGNLGIGTFDGLDGGMLLIDGQLYQIRADGVAVTVDGSRRTPFAIITHFEPDQVEIIQGPLVHRFI